MNKPSKWHWALIVIALTIILGVMSGPNGKVDKLKTPEIAKIVDPEKVPDNVIKPLSFDLPKLNARVEMRCINPGVHDGFGWYVESLDGKHPPQGDKVFFTFARSKQETIAPSGWRGIKPTSDKIPVGDAFMLTAIQLKDVGADTYRHFVFSVADSLDDVRKTKEVVYITVELVTLTSSVTMDSHPCSTLQTN